MIRNLGAAGVLGVLLASCAPTPVGTLAIYSGGVVTEAEVEEALQARPQAKRQPAAGVELEQWLKERLEEVALREHLIAVAQREGVDHEGALELRLRFAVAQDLGRALIESRCPSAPIDEEALEREVAERLEGAGAEWLLLRHIFKEVAPGAGPSQRRVVRRQLEEIAAELARGADFVQMARLHSDSSSASNGGLIGRLSRQAPMERRVLEVAWGLDDGEVSDLVEVDNGFHLLLREGSGVDAPQEESTREQARRELVLAERASCIGELLTGLGRDSGLELVEEAFSPGASSESVALRVAGEEFTIAQLMDQRAQTGTWGAGASLAQMGRVLGEALVLESAYLQEENGAAERRSDSERRFREGLLLEAQWKTELERWAAERPEDELRSFFDDNTDLFRQELRMDVAIILLSGSGSRRAAWEKAREARRRLESGEDFDDLAREISMHASASDGGRLEAMAWSDIERLVGSDGRDKVLSLEPGEVSEPFQVGERGSRYALIKILSRAEPLPLDFDEARPLVLEALTGQRANETRAAVRRRVLESIDFHLVDRAVSEYLDRLGA